MSRKRVSRIESGVELWQCTRCELWFDRANFYTEKRSSLGIKSECKGCHTKTSMESRDKENHRKTNREWMASSDYGKRPHVREKERMRSRRRCASLEVKCRDILNDAVSNGIVIKPQQCERCCKVTQQLQAHHESYYWPLRVEWLCTLCHGIEHRVATERMLS